MLFRSVIILKLQGWLHHKDSSREDLIKKQRTDVEDIRGMVGLWATKYMERKLWKEGWMSIKFKEAGHNMVEQFLKEFPDTSHHWKAMGFTLLETLPVLETCMIPGTVHSVT